MTASNPWGTASRASIEPGLVEEEEGLCNAHRLDRHRTANMGAANKKSGILETVQYRKNPTSLLQSVRARTVVFGYGSLLTSNDFEPSRRC